MRLRTVVVPGEMRTAFEAAEGVVSRYFAERRETPEHGSIDVHGQRYILVRAASLSIEFFDLVRGLYGDVRRAEADEFARNILFDLAHAIARSDARRFHEDMKLVDPIERLSAGPVHFAYTGWASVEISRESRATADEHFYLLYDHPYSFEATAWIDAKRTATFPVCVMSAGYSSGWCQESFGVTVVATEILCRARGDEVCRFVMAPPDRIEALVAKYRAERPGLNARAHQIPDFFSRKRMEEELRRSRDELEHRVTARTAELAEANRRLLQAQKLEAIGRLTSGIAHDFNNLLAVVMMRTGRLQLEIADLGALHEDLQEIQNACTRGASLSRKLLTFSRQSVFKKVLLELGQVTRDMQRTLLPLVGEDITVSVSIETEAYIEGDQSQLEQVLLNLVVNARDAMPAGGTLRMSVDVVVLPETTLATGTLVAGSYARLCVQDSGIGMDSDTITKIFDPFFTTKPDDRGTGLGLSTVYGIVSQAGGAIGVQSEQGRGTTFTVYWPSAASRSAPGITAPRISTSDEPPAALIMVVEDQPGLRGALDVALRSTGHTVYAVDSADGAVELLENLQGKIDILLTDLVLPRSSGRELARTVRARWPLIQVIYMTGYDRDATDASASDVALVVLRKPFTISELNRSIASAMANDSR